MNAPLKPRHNFLGKQKTYQNILTISCWIKITCYKLQIIIKQWQSVKFTINNLAVFTVVAIEEFRKILSNIFLKFNNSFDRIRWQLPILNLTGVWNGMPSLISFLLLGRHLLVFAWCYQGPVHCGSLKVFHSVFNFLFQGSLEIGNLYYIYTCLYPYIHISIYLSHPLHLSIYFSLFTMYLIFVKLTHSVDVFPIFVSFKKGYASTIFCAIVRLSSSVGYLVLVEVSVQISLKSWFLWLGVIIPESNPVST